TFLSPAAIATKEANQIRTLNAALFEITSSQVMTLLKTIIETTAIAAVVELIPKLLPKIQRRSAITANEAIKISLGVIFPNCFNSSAAQAGASGDCFCVGG